MKRKIFTTVALVCCFMICLAAAISDLTGKWVGTLNTPDGNQVPLSYVLKADGANLTGTATTPQGDISITDGKITGDTFSFNVSLNGSDFKHSGKFYAAADSVGLDVDANGMKFHTTLKRDNK
jgi:hypothetical protein